MMRNPISWWIFTPYGAEEDRTLDGRIQKINQPFEQSGAPNRGNRKTKSSCSLPILSLDGSNGPRPTLKITCLSQHLYYGYAQISSGRCHWKSWANGENDRILEIRVSNKNKKLEMPFLSASDRNHGYTILLFSWTAPVIKSSEAIKHVGYSTITTGPISLDQPI